MPLIDKPLEELKVYRGLTPAPADFDAYWAEALRELDATDPAAELVRSKAIRPPQADCFDLWFRGAGGARIYAKYVRPKNRPAPGPAVLQFHGYTLDSGDWVDMLAYAGQGLAVAALDCRGQGGRSEDNTPVKGNTHHGHFIRGLDDAPDKLLFRRIFLDTVLHRRQKSRPAHQSRGFDGPLPHGPDLPAFNPVRRLQRHRGKKGMPHLSRLRP